MRLLEGLLINVHESRALQKPEADVSTSIIVETSGIRIISLDLEAARENFRERGYVAHGTISGIDATGKRLVVMIAVDRSATTL